MAASVVSAATSTSQRLVVESIGSASPSLAGVLADQLGVAPDRVATALYRAPAILMDALPLNQAQQLANILRQAGLVIRVESSAAPRPEPGATYDIAVYIEDPTDVPDCCERLSGFLGCTAVTALNMLLAPPGVVLGNVSLATRDALARQLKGLAVQVVSSPRDKATYQLLIEREPGPMLDRLLQDLKQMGLAANNNHTLFLDHQQASQLWRRHQAAGGLRLLDCTFLRYELSLTQITPASRTEQLPELAGLPAELVDTVIANLPVVVEEGISHGALTDRLRAWQSAGMPVEVSLSSLRRCHLTIPAGSFLEPALPLLQQAGLLAADSGSPALPWHSPILQGELLPRWLQAGLEQLDIPAIWEELPHEPQ